MTSLSDLLICQDMLTHPSAHKASLITDVSVNEEVFKENENEGGEA